MKGNNLYKFLFLSLLFLFTFPKADEITDTMKNYCVVPPFMEVNTKPNIILMMDFSESMQYPLHYNSGEITYDGSKTYYGYFKSNGYKCHVKLGPSDLANRYYSLYHLTNQYNFHTTT